MFEPFSYFGCPRGRSLAVSHWERSAYSVQRRPKLKNTHISRTYMLQNSSYKSSLLFFILRTSKIAAVQGGASRVGSWRANCGCDRTGQHTTESLLRTPASHVYQNQIRGSGTARGTKEAAGKFTARHRTSRVCCLTQSGSVCQEWQRTLGEEREGRGLGDH